MTSITISYLLTTIYVLVDDWYQAEGQNLLAGKPGAKPEFSDSEMMTLMLAQDFIPYPGEAQFVGFMRANYLPLFPKLLDQSQCNRRSRALRFLVERLRQAWLLRLGVRDPKQLLLDTKPIPVLGYKRSKKHSAFAGRAGYGYCAARELSYFGYKLVMLTTLDGLPVLSDLLPPNLHAPQAADHPTQQLRTSDTLSP